MGCRCLKSNELKNENNIIVIVPEYNVIEPIDNPLIQKKEFISISNKKISSTTIANVNNNNINVKGEDGTSSPVNLNKNNEKKLENIPKKSETSIKMINRILSSNTGSNWENNNFNSSFLGGRINQSYNLEHTDTRGKTYTKSLINCTTLNLSFYNAFSIDMVREINMIRSNPISYADKIQDFMKYINTDKKTMRKYFLVNKNTKINLLNGEKAFVDCLEFIKNFDKKMKEEKITLKELEFKEELKFPFPADDAEKCIDKTYIKENLIILKKNLEGSFKLRGFHYDLSTNDPEISAILQLVDDNNSGGKRRNMLLDESIRYVGVNIGKLKENLYCIYLVFAS